MVDSENSKSPSVDLDSASDGIIATGLGMVATGAQLTVMTATTVGSGILGFLQTANAAREAIPGGILAYFDALMSMGENVSQTFVDAVCRYAAWMVNVSVERIRQKVLKSVYEHNAVVRIIVEVIDIGK